MPGAPGEPGQRHHQPLHPGQEAAPAVGATQPRELDAGRYIEREIGRYIGI